MMDKNKWNMSQLSEDKMSLNDYLSLKRTRLAVERTHLSYMRTVVSMVVASITLYKLVPDWEGCVAAGILLLSAIYFYIRGKKVCRETQEFLHDMEEEE